MIHAGIGFDTETRLIRPGVQAPPAVSLQWTEINNNQVSRPYLMGGAGSYDAILDRFIAWLRTNGLILYGANTAYDMLCLVSVAGRLYGYDAAEELLNLVFAKYRANEVTDVLTRQKIIDLSAGCYRGYADERGKWHHYGYNLEDVTFRHTGRKLSENEEWRLRYGELEDVPLSAWPGGAVAYALADGLGTGQSAVEQTHLPPATLQNFPGMDPFVDEFNRARGAFWLKLESVWGLRTKPASVDKFAREVSAEYNRLANELADPDPGTYGADFNALVYREYKLDRKAIVQRIQSIGKLHLITRTDQVGASKLTLASAPLLETGDPLLSLCAIWRRIREGLDNRESRSLEAFHALEAAGLATCEFHKSTKAAGARMKAVCYAQNRSVRATDKGGIALDKETCDASGDPLLQSYAELSSLSKTMSNDIPALRSGVYYPIHTRFEELLDTGRTASSNPNVQNIRRLPGIRECFVPRAGNVFLDADYGKLELHTLAQICLWKLGYSSLAEALKSGMDPHLKVGATMAHISYKEAEIRKAAGDDDISNRRDCGKVANFGIPGGLGADTLVTYAAKSYGVRITRDEAVALKKDYFDTFQEMPEYFRYVNSLETYPGSGSYNVVQPWSNRLRADATFCAACNSLFQGLGADVAMLAGWFIAEACYINKRDALYGCRPVDFIHDQWLVEAREDIANDAAKSLVFHMDRAADIVLPDCPTRASILLARVWSKKAKKIEVKQPNGETIILPWEPKEVAA